MNAAQAETAHAEAVLTSIDELVERARALASTGERRILGITGTPGAGKSTLSRALLEALGAQAALVEMDGFHLANQELHRLGRRDRKGAPDTFDVDGYQRLLERLREPSDRVVYAPVFNRELEEAIANAAPIDPRVPLIITEGNYLLCAEHGWDHVRDRLDEAWYIEITPELRLERLVQRRLSHGHPLDAATAWVNQVDERNAATVNRTRSRADRIVRLAESR